MAMRRSRDLSRRAFLALAGAAPFAAPFAARLASAAAKIPVGLELYTVRDALKSDLMGTVRAVAKIGYEVVEFYAPYYDWTPQQASDVRKLLDDLSIHCKSTHNGPVSFSAEGIQKAIDLNKTIGSTLIVMASPGRVTSADEWKRVAEQLSTAAEKLKAVGMSAGYHNHGPEWHAIDGGQRPMDILAANTHDDVVLQLDVGTCVEAGQDPVAWIKAHPGRIKSMHCKDWSHAQGYAALFGEGEAPWPAIFTAAESTGGIECYLIEQEEGPASEQLQRAERCLANWKKLRTGRS
jgi:sugar phosphate isomerase/epimerase